MTMTQQRTASPKQIAFIKSLADERDSQHPLVAAVLEAFATENVYMLSGRLIDELKKIPRLQTARSSRPLVTAEGPAVTIPLGTYTVVFDNDNDYVTLKVTRASFIKDEVKTMISYMSGPDNDLSYTGFAFVNENGINLWKKFREDTRLTTATKLLWALAQRDAGLNEAHEMFLEFAEAHALRSGSCARCGKTLTVPASLHRGLGPDCAMAEGL